MSEMTRCNYCTLRDVKARAKKRGAKVMIARPQSGDWAGWIEVRESDRGERPTHYFRALGDHCEC